MNRCVVFTAVVAVVCAFFFGWYYNQLVPGTLPNEQVRGLKAFGASLQACKFLGYIASLVGIGEPVKNFRKGLDLFTGAFTKEDPSLHVEDVMIANVPVRVYRPKDLPAHDKKLTGLVYFHGGGWTLGSIDLYHSQSQIIAREAQVVLVNVEYRLAPEHTFPAHFDDCLAVVEALLVMGEKFGIDTNRVVVAGDSAGGNLAAAVALKLKDEKKKPAAQILIFPALQFMDFNLSSYRNREHALLTKQAMVDFWSLYITGTPSMASTFLANNHSLHLRNTKYSRYLGAQDKPQKTQSKPSSEIPQSVLAAMTDYRAAPLMADDLEGLPKTMLITCEFDVLKDEGVLYKARLQEAGVQVTHYHYNTYHAFMLFQATGMFLSDEWHVAFGHLVDYLKDVQ